LIHAPLGGERSHQPGFQIRGAAHEIQGGGCRRM
jgi:hypothetical protein